MSKLRKFLTPGVTLGIFVLAVILLLVSSIGGTRAALTYFSDTYASRVQMYDIGVTLLENNEPVSWRDYQSAGDGTWDENTGELLLPLKKDLEEKNEDFKLGVKYPEELSVLNSGTINQYVRVTIYKYWLNEDGEKDQLLSPDLIHLNFVNLNNHWTLDETSSTAERTVLYYNELLPSGQMTEPFTDTLSIDGALGAKVRQIVEGNTITTVYEYDGYSFEILAVVDAVQEHNAADAMRSAWGVVSPAA